MEALMIGLLVWLGTNTDYELPKHKSELPKVAYSSQRDMQEAVFGKHGPGMARKVRAFYDPKANIIWVLRGFDPGDPTDKRSMVHELVHYLQKLNGMVYPCLQAVEPEAFRLSMKWYRQQGLRDPEYELWTIISNGACVYEVPP